MPILWAMRPPWNTSIFEISSWKSFQKVFYLGPSEQMLMQNSDACCERTFHVPEGDCCNNWLWLFIWKRSKGGRQVHPLFVICSTVCKVPVGLLSSCRYIYNFIFTFLMFATLIQPPKLSGGYMSAEDLFCSLLCCASINTSMILLHTSSTRNERMKP